MAGTGAGAAGANGGAWSYLGVETVERHSGGAMIPLPDGVFESGLLRRPDVDDAGAEAAVTGPESPDRVEADGGGGDGHDHEPADPAGTAAGGAVRAHWSFESLSGTLILSNAELTDQPRFKAVGSAKVQGSANRYRATIPKPFFDDSASALERVPEKARVAYDQERFFLARERMLAAEPASAYVVPGDRLAAMIGDLGELATAYEELPKFLQ
jgi:hypothetical protein